MDILSTLCAACFLALNLADFLRELENLLFLISVCAIGIAAEQYRGERTGHVHQPHMSVSRICVYYSRRGQGR